MTLKATQKAAVVAQMYEKAASNVELEEEDDDLNESLLARERSHCCQCWKSFDDFVWLESHQVFFIHAVHEYCWRKHCMNSTS